MSTQVDWDFYGVGPAIHVSAPMRRQPRDTDERVELMARLGCAVTEGLCPSHCTPLCPDPRLPGAGGLCPACDLWMYTASVPHGPLFVIEAAHDPDGQPVTHPWMGAGG